MKEKDKEAKVKVCCVCEDGAVGEISVSEVVMVLVDVEIADRLLPM